MFLQLSANYALMKWIGLENIVSSGLFSLNFFLPSIFSSTSKDMFVTFIGAQQYSKLHSNLNTIAYIDNLKNKEKINTKSHKEESGGKQSCAE